MKKILAVICLIITAKAMTAQKCLNLNIASMMDKMEVPGTAATSFKKCNIGKNDYSQVTIENYGTDLKDLDTMIARASVDFNKAVVSGAMPSNMQMPSQQDVNASKQLAEEIKSMTPEQQKEFAMQMAQQQMKNAKAAPMQDDAATIKSVYDAQNIATIQMKSVNDELSNKLHAIDQAASKEKEAVQRDSKSKCPGDVTGLPACDCANAVEAKYWKQIIAIEDNYNNQKIALLQTYLPKIKGLAASIDATVSKLKNGDAVKSASLKQTLFSSQSSGFANAFVVTSGCIEQVRKDGADAYVNKLNSDNGVYDLSCSHK